MYFWLIVKSTIAVVQFPKKVSASPNKKNNLCFIMRGYYKLEKRKKNCRLVHDDVETYTLPRHPHDAPGIGNTRQSDAPASTQNNKALWP